MLKMNGFNWIDKTDNIVPAKLEFDTFSNDGLALNVLTDDEKETRIDTLTTSRAYSLAEFLDKTNRPENPMDYKINRQLELRLSEKTEKTVELLLELGIIDNPEPHVFTTKNQVVCWLFDMTDEATREFIKVKEAKKEI